MTISFQPFFHSLCTFAVRHRRQLLTSHFVMVAAGCLWLASGGAAFHHEQSLATGVHIFLAGSLLGLLPCSLLWTMSKETDRRVLDLELRAEELAQANARISSDRDQLEISNSILGRSNQELREFAFAASHDLQTPLRGISNYAQFLNEDYRDCLNHEGRQFLDGIITSADRMKTLTADLLEYAQVESKGRESQPADLSEVVSDVLILLQTEIESNMANVSFDRLPQVNCDARQMSQLFRNLVTNGIKYRGENSPEITISSEVTDSVRITIADNGIGIEEKYHTAIFDIFRRLHTQEEYPGTGIGLALCQKIIQRHNGTISVESTPRVGSRFTITLPLATLANQAES